MQRFRILAAVVALAGAALTAHSVHGAGMASVRVAHASPNAPAVDVYVDGTKAFAGVTFPQITAYAHIPSGSHHIQVFPAGASPTGRGVIDATVTLASGKIYTVAAAGVLKSIAPIVLLDRNATPSRGKARVRFVHLSPDAPKVDLGVAGGPTLFRHVAFGHATRYVSVPARTYNFVVRVAGTSTVALRVNHVKLSPGTVYTVFAEGLAMGKPKLEAVLSADHSAGM